jgi:GxxExxY protein
MEVINHTTETIIGAAIAIHQELGPDLLKSTCETCLAYELAKRGLRVERQKGWHPPIDQTIKTK